MIHPSYVELMNVVDKSGKTGESPVNNGRYSIVAATAKRARQLTDGAEPYIDVKEGEKPLSIAVAELYSGKLKILSQEEAATKDLELIEFRQREAENRKREDEERARREAEENLAKAIINSDTEEDS